jgi:putative transcription factor
MEKELVSNYAEVIKDARKKKGLSREDLGFNIGERTVTIAKIENGDLRPSDKIVEKLEKELEIRLMEEVKSISSSRGSASSGLTLGDFIKSEK